MVHPFKTLVSAGLASALLVTGFAVAPTMAKADSAVRADGSYDVAQYYNRGPGWHGHGPRPGYGPRYHPGWRGPGYYPRPGYRGNYYYNDYNAALAAGVFGLAAGAIIGGAAANNQRYGGSSYDSYCSQRYRSFNPATGTYTGYDGRQHRCIAPE